MLPTPSTSHVSFDAVYEPAEDSFLFLDTLSEATETAWLAKRFAPTSPTPLVAEIGTGSGVVVAFVAAHAKKIVGRDDVLTVGVDANVKACHATDATVGKAVAENASSAVYLGSVCADLTTAFRGGTIDMLIFNPPYVPTSELPALPTIGRSPSNKFERNSHLLSLSYAGGKDGMETTNRLLAAVPHILSRTGVAYVLLCAQNKPETVKRSVERGWPEGWKAETVRRSGNTAGWEKLEIIRLWKE